MMKQVELYRVEEELKKGKAAILAKLGQEYGFVVPGRSREAIEDQVGPPGDIDGDPEYMKGYLEQYEDIARFYCEAFREGQAKGDGKHIATGTERGPYQKSFERRLRLVEFVTDSWARGNGNRFDWKRIASEWNESFPIEQINPEVLRVEYSRAIHENDLMSHLLAMLCLKDRQTGEKPWGKDEFQQFFLQDAALDPTKKGEPFLSLRYKHYVLTDKKREISGRSIKTMLTLAGRYRKMSEKESQK
jgi:hypothetical protein